MKEPITIITVVEGGVLQQVYCPDPSIILNQISLDYDLAESGDKTDLEDLVHALESAYSAERAFHDAPSTLLEFSSYSAQLLTLRNSESKT